MLYSLKFKWVYLSQASSPKEKKKQVPIFNMKIAIILTLSISFCAVAYS